MQPFLRTIAREYSSRYSSLKSVCFLFPNKRCGIFLKKYLAEFGISSDQLPHILTISEFMAQIARKTEANRIVQLFVLFNAYKELIDDDSSIEFDTFRGWGETVISDFNTVDMAMADPTEVFKNVKDYRTITSNFLTEEQKDVMREYFGVEDFDDSSSFWKNFNEPEKDTPLKQRFLNLWQILAPLHHKFVETLHSEGYGSSGSIYRAAAEKILENNKNTFPYKKIVVIGFNALTEAERLVFKGMRDMEGFPGYDSFTDFIWDAAGPFLNGENVTASKFVKYNMQHFPMPEWLQKLLHNEKTNEYPEICIISSPSLSSQAKVAGELLKSYISPQNKSLIDDSQVALILPDESLLSNTLYSIPEEIGTVNLTMGFSLRQTPISSFLSILRRVFLTARENLDDIVFYVKDLRILFSHPYSQILFNNADIASLLEFLNRFHKISVSLSQIAEYIPEAPIYLKFPSKKEKGEDIFIFLDKIFTRLLDKISSMEPDSTENEDISQITIYADYVKSLEEAVLKYSIEATPLSVMLMADRLISNEKIGFEGEPLYGLQVMGTLETRSLDFRHIIVMSMNEGKMPRRTAASTFIPASLRNAYGLPPARYAEEIFSYYFYRLISRAEKVTLIYDGRAVSGMRGGVSRYIMQLRHFAPEEKILEVDWQYRLKNRQKFNASFEKTPEIFERTQVFSLDNENRKNFSASSLNTYRECQVKFFLQNLLDLNSDPERGDFMNSIEIGNVLHDSMMALYLPISLQRKLLKNPVVITKDFLENILSHREIIKNEVTRSINRIYYFEKENPVKEIESGVTQIIADQISQLIEEIIRYDITLTPFNLYGCEISENLKVKLKSGRIVNFRFAIDRLDEITIDGNPHLRIVDYKTGGRKRYAKSLEEVFNGGYESEQLFQLFTYAWLLGKLNVKGWEDVVTEIYFVPDLIEGKRGLPEIAKEKVESFRPYIEEFSNRLEAMIESVFESPIFTENQNAVSCTNCTFKSFCRK